MSGLRESCSVTKINQTWGMSTHVSRLSFCFWTDFCCTDRKAFKSHPNNMAWLCDMISKIDVRWWCSIMDWPFSVNVANSLIEKFKIFINWIVNHWLVATFVVCERIAQRRRQALPQNIQIISSDSPFIDLQLSLVPCLIIRFSRWHRIANTTGSTAISNTRKGTFLLLTQQPKRLYFQ